MFLPLVILAAGAQQLVFREGDRAAAARPHLAASMAPRLRVDLRVLNGEVTEDISVVWDAIWVERAGVGKSHSGWMESP